MRIKPLSSGMYIGVFGKDSNANRFDLVPTLATTFGSDLSYEGSLRDFTGSKFFSITTKLVHKEIFP